MMLTDQFSVCTSSSASVYQATSTIIPVVDLAVPVNQIVDFGNSLFGEENVENGGAISEIVQTSSAELELVIHPALTLTMLQAPTAFNGVGIDSTGGVLWGAGVCLARWLKEEQVRDKYVLELGCGGGAPSMVASKYNATHVLSTDFEISTLERMDLHIKLNNCQQNMELRKLDWQDLDVSDDYQADVILASDIIYGVSKLSDLVNTVDKYLAPVGTLFLATRDGRQGIAEFRQMMSNQFVEAEMIPCDASQLNAQVMGRWFGSHTIHVFQRK